MCRIAASDTARSPAVDLEDLSGLGDRLVLGILADRLVQQQPDRAAAPVAPDPDGPGP